MDSRQLLNLKRLTFVEAFRMDQFSKTVDPLEVWRAKANRYGTADSQLKSDGEAVLLSRLRELQNKVDEIEGTSSKKER